MSQLTQTANSNTTSNTSPPATAGEIRYFNEYANGIGYLNSVREFAIEGKPVRYAAQVSVIQGPADNVHYEYHDLVIVSETALAVVRQYRDAIDAEDTKVLIRFSMTNPRAKAFVYKHGERAGETGVAIGGFLSRIFSVKLNGELVYTDPSVMSDQQDQA